MKRRTLLAGLLASPALMPSAGTAEESGFQIRSSRFMFFDDDEPARPNWLLLGTGNRIRGWDLRPEVREYPVETVNTRMLGRLFRSSFKQRLRGGSRLGTVYLNGRRLIVPHNADVRRAAIAHKRTEWYYNRRPRWLLLNTPLVGSMFRGSGVGSAYLSEDRTEVLILIRPTVLHEF